MNQLRSRTLEGSIAALVVFSTALAMTEDPAKPPDASSGGESKGGSSGAAATEDSEGLAKKLQNPVADLISVPLQENVDFGIGSEDAERSVLNVQPVIPISLTADWNLITRTIVPLIYQEAPTSDADDEFGLGDILQSFFVSPKDPVGGWILGAGPVFLYPSATDDSLGAEKWGAGPTAVLLRQQDGWTYGLLANHVWSFAGEDDRAEVNATFLQPFVSYTFKTATSVVVNTESAFDWREDQWTVPLNLQLSQLVPIGKQPVSFLVGGRYYAEAPDGGPEWGLRFAMTLLFPRK